MCTSYILCSDKYSSCTFQASTGYFCYNNMVLVTNNTNNQKVIILSLKVSCYNLKKVFKIRIFSCHEVKLSRFIWGSDSNMLLQVYTHVLLKESFIDDQRLVLHVTMLHVHTHKHTSTVTNTLEHSVVGQMVLCCHIQADLQINRVTVTAVHAHRPAPSQALAFHFLFTAQELLL